MSETFEPEPPAYRQGYELGYLRGMVESVIEQLTSLRGMVESVIEQVTSLRAAVESGSEQVTSLAARVAELERADDRR